MDGSHSPDNLAPVSKKQLRLLVANRGEIARRVIRTGVSMGFKVGVLVAADDADSIAATFVPPDCRVAVPSYLDIGAVVAAARSWNANVVHPGYGFLSENPEFVGALEAAGILFAGPTAAQMRSLGDKENAKRLAQRLGVPTLAAVYAGDLGPDPVKWPQVLDDVGIKPPWLIKASGGGGGRGMRVVTQREELAAAIQRASQEAAAGFGNPAVFVERYLERTRHIEVQIFGDGVGGGVALAERECSLQRRHQKVVEEAPSPVVSPELRRVLGASALKFVKETKYSGAGTVEFLLADDGSISFLEVNARLQVEHPVTEEVFGVDLVAAQLRLATWGQWSPELGDPVALEVREPKGHAIEVRVLTEDPWNGFKPTPGEVWSYFEPGDGTDYGLALGFSSIHQREPAHQLRQAKVRIESALVTPGPRRPLRVNPSYDSMVAKVIGVGASRTEARSQLLDGLERMVVTGVKTNLDFLQALLRSSVFESAAFHTKWIEENLEALERCSLERMLAVGPGAHSVALRLRDVLLRLEKLEKSSFIQDSEGLVVQIFSRNNVVANEGARGIIVAWIGLSGSQIRDWAYQCVAGLSSKQPGYLVSKQLLDIASGATCLACVTYVPGGSLGLTIMGVSHAIDVSRQGGSSGTASGSVSGVISAPMPGKLLAVAVVEGDIVAERQVLFVLESMKMQIEITAPSDGVVSEVLVATGQTVEVGYSLCQFREKSG
jgi:acetyl/propionyl-CoA carboxylase alpha subunit